jgi:hypothetical protein
VAPDCLRAALSRCLSAVVSLAAALSSRRDQPCAKPATAWERWYQRLVPEIAEEILPPRRNRINPRVIKQKMRK